MSDLSISPLNSLSSSHLGQELFKCCGCNAWVENMKRHLPYTNVEDLVDKANSTWWHLPIIEWKVAFSAHPKIGDASALKAKFSAKDSWEGEEQKGANTASEDTLRQLAQLNNDYENKFGYIFLICATGKSALEMLNALEDRMNNDAATEIQIAAGEQAKIIRLRLFKLLESLNKQQQQNQSQQGMRSRL